MKSLKPLLTLIVLTFLLSACKKNSNVDTPFAASMSFKVGGKLEQNTLAPVAQVYVGNNVNTIQITGDFNTTEGISLTIPNPAVGTFDVVKNNLTLAYTTQPDFNYAYLAISGSLTITSLTSNIITGTFQFTGTNGLTSTTKKITGGNFAANITKM